MAHTDPHGHASGHETRDVDLSGSNRFILVMTLFLAFVFALMWFTFVRWQRAAVATAPQVPAVAQREGDRLPPLPRLQTTPYADLKSFRASEQEVLDGYGWVDPERGIVRIPIARALEILAERGLPPAWPEPATEAAASATSAAAGASSR